MRGGVHSTVQLIFADRVEELLGPKPCRSRQWPRGFPWDSAKTAARARIGKVLVDLLADILEDLKDTGLTSRVVFFGEHPLGYHGSFQPASIWQWPELRKAAGDVFHRAALYQCNFCDPKKVQQGTIPSQQGSYPTPSVLPH